MKERVFRYGLATLAAVSLFWAAGREAQSRGSAFEIIVLIGLGFAFAAYAGVGFWFW